MKRLWIIIPNIVALLAIACVLLVLNQNTKNEISSVSQSQVDEVATKNELLKLINEERRRANIPNLTLVESLNQSAQWKADRMLETGNFTHIDPKTGKKDGIEYGLNNNKNCNIVSENLIAENDDTNLSSQEAVKGWMSSEAHKNAILNSDYTTTGFGITNKTIVEHFCKSF